MHKLPHGTVYAVSPHELNLDAAQRELDRRNAEGEDVSGLFVNPITYAIEPRPVDDAQALQADLERNHNKGPKLARRDDARAFDQQTGADQLRVVLDFEQREIAERDLNLARAWSGLGSSDLDLPKGKA